MGLILRRVKLHAHHSADTPEMLVRIPKRRKRNVKIPRKNQPRRIVFRTGRVCRCLGIYGLYVHQKDAEPHRFELIRYRGANGDRNVVACECVAILDAKVQNACRKQHYRVYIDLNRGRGKPSKRKLAAVSGLSRTRVSDASWDPVEVFIKINLLQLMSQTFAVFVVSTITKNRIQDELEETLWTVRDALVVPIGVSSAVKFRQLVFQKQKASRDRPHLLSPGKAQRQAKVTDPFSTPRANLSKCMKEYRGISLDRSGRRYELLAKGCR